MKNYEKGKENSIKKYSTQKLICDRTDKTNYLSHYQNLQFYIKTGMKMTNLHSIFSSKQKPFMKDYILDNIDNRKIAKDLEQDFALPTFKLLNNVVFGKPR